MRDERCPGTHGLHGHSWGLWTQARDPMHDLTTELWWRYERECMMLGCSAKQYVEDLDPLGRSEVRS